MNKYKLPSMEYSFSIQVTGKESKVNWAGEFLYRRPDLSERGLIDAMRARLNGDLVTISIDIALLNTALAHLRFTLREYPVWWEDCDYGGAMYDSNVVMELYNKCINYEARWSQKISGNDPSKVEVKGEAGTGKKARKSVSASPS